jgi:hypothetical protein
MQRNYYCECLFVLCYFVVHYFLSELFSLRGGVAGGSKFLLEGILYKLAQDTERIYGSDEIAMTSCSHDLKGVCFRSH